jgi:hypothetical protein
MEDGLKRMNNANGGFLCLDIILHLEKIFIRLQQLKWCGRLQSLRWMLYVEAVCEAQAKRLCVRRKPRGINWMPHQRGRRIIGWNLCNTTNVLDGFRHEIAEKLRLL